ncbi:hypothetical protein [Vibrio mediterranei]|uniref:hypothetical protein n=1 Tax=Vibrio mediterranei TaxID=689 RepID=UPI0022847F1D|nr:hypothetical protein [Vibrio mediterranei]MCY9855314.1 hypothetical protein [Vibrio mediterranei]
MHNYGMLESEGYDKAERRPQIETAAAINEIIVKCFKSNAVTCVYLDADLEDRTLNVITRHAGIVGKCIVYKIVHPDSLKGERERPRQVIFHRNQGKEAPIDAMLNELVKKRLDSKAMGSDGNKFSIIVGNKEDTYEYCNAINHQGLKCCLINADTASGKIIGHQSKSLMSKEISEDDFDVLIYNSSITSGVSWTSPNFARCIIIATGIRPWPNDSTLSLRKGSAHFRQNKS